MISPQPRPSSVTPTISAVKGHLVTKSSETIDNNPPKSLTASQKARDRVRREMVGSLSLNKSLNSQRARSADLMRESRSIDDQKGLNSSPTASARQTRSARVTKTERTSEIKPRALPNQEKLNKSMANLMTKFTMNNKNRVPIFKPETARPSNQKEGDENDMLVNRMRPLMAHPNNVEDKTKTALTTLLFSAKNPENSQGLHPALTAMSKLVAGHSYDVMELHSERFTQPSKEFEPRIKNREKSKSSLVDQRSCYQPPRIRRRNTTSNKSIQLQPKNLDKDRELDRIDSEYELNNSRAAQDQNELRRKLEQQAMNESRQSQIKYRKAMEKEEELKYLEFIKTVTDDILSRGISSNRVINNCFEYHIKRNRHLLDERKMRDLLESLRVDIGVPGEDLENADLDASHYQSVNKAVSLDRGRQRGANTMDELPDPASYLTLQKFGWSSINNPPRSPLKESNQKPTSNTSINMNVWQQIDAEDDLNQPKTSSRRESSKSIQFNQTDNLFDTYENQIAQNIQSIRRNSLGNNESSIGKPVSGESIPPSQQSSQTSVKQTTSILKKSPEQSRHSSNSGESRGPGSPVGKKSQVLSNQNTSNLSNLSGALKSSNHGETNVEDDDDDVFSSEYRPMSPKKSPVRSKENINASKQTITKRSSLNTSNASSTKGQNQNHVKDEYADDILFNDNYGEDEKSDRSKSNSPPSQKKSSSPSNKGSPRKQSYKDEEDSTDYEGPFSNDEDEDTDKFDKLLKTKSFQKNSSQQLENATRRRSSGNSTIRSGDYDDEEDSANLPSQKSTRRSSGGSQETPRPAPRKTSNPRYQTKPSARSDEDDEY